MRVTRRRGAVARVPAALCALVAGLGAVLVAGCGGPAHVDPYAVAVSEYTPPIYCYRTIGDVDCYRRPLLGAERRLVNFYGPPPGDYEKPEPAPAPRLHPPPPAGAAASNPASQAAPAPAAAVELDNRPTVLYPPEPPSVADAAKPSEAAGGGTASTVAAPGKAVMTATPLRPTGAHAGGRMAPGTPPAVTEVEGG